MKKIAIIFGTRPEFIKIYPIYLESIKYFNTVLINTGQHQEMLNNILLDFNINPKYNGNIMQESKGLNEILTNSLKFIDKALDIEKPDLVLVHGDTSATLAGALSSFYKQIQVGHIEAGLRTYNKKSPFPEEVNRLLVGDIVDYHFTPTYTTYDNLIKENKNKDDIYIVGNSAIDMLKYTIRNDWHHNIIDKINSNKKIILITIHRRENIKVLVSIFSAINNLANKYFNEYQFVYPIHMNPEIRKIAKEQFTQKNIYVVEPLETIDFHNFMKKSEIILTDSGGIQEEALGINKPVFVVRDTTERPEGVLAGALKLTGTDEKEIINIITSHLDNKELLNKMISSDNPYGDGTTAEQIMKIIKDKL